jgi:hypothetical protein
MNASWIRCVSRERESSEQTPIKDKRSKARARECATERMERNTTLYAEDGTCRRAAG